VLDTYGITIGCDFERWLRIVSSDEELAAWFGSPLEDYVLRDLGATLAPFRLEVEEELDAGAGAGPGGVV
jgi:hypothetical protein